jgi:hypothetical protein
MRKASSFGCALISSLALVAGWGQTGPATSDKAKDATTPSRSLAVASVRLAGGHRVDFFAPPDGPIAIAEVGPKGTKRVVDEETAAHKRPSEIYTMLKGAGAVPPPALVQAEKRLGALAAKHRTLPAPNEGGAGKGPDDTADQQWFKSTFCKQYWECVQGWTWANTSGGHHQGRGYAADAMNGSEARGARTLETDWWNGSNWAPLITESMPPGWWAWTIGGNTGHLNCGDPIWYFKSEVPNNGLDNATVSIADHVYAPGGGDHIDCYDVPPCPCSCGCGGCPAGRGGGNFITCGSVSICVRGGTGNGTDADDYCVNPP